MSFRKNSINLRDESLLINKTRTRIVIRVINLNIFFKNVFKINTKTNHYFTIIKTKLL